MKTLNYLGTNILNLSDCEIEVSGFYGGNDGSFAIDGDRRTKATIVPDESNKAWLRITLYQVRFKMLKRMVRMIHNIYHKSYSFFSLKIIQFLQANTSSLFTDSRILYPRLSV